MKFRKRNKIQKGNKQLSPTFKSRLWNLATTCALILGIDAYLKYRSLGQTFQPRYFAETVALIVIPMLIVLVVWRSFHGLPWSVARLIVGAVASCVTVGPIFVLKFFGVAGVLNTLQSIGIIKPGENVTFVASAYFGASLTGLFVGFAGIWFTQLPKPRLPKVRVPNRSGLPQGRTAPPQSEPARTATTSGQGGPPPVGQRQPQPGTAPYVPSTSLPHPTGV